MAMVQCPECKREVSSQATACPHCGAPRAAVRKGVSPWTIIGWVIVAFVALLAYSCVQVFKATTNPRDPWEAPKLSTAAPPLPPAPMELTIESFRCEQRGDDTRAEITVRNSGPGPITMPKVFFDFEGQQEDSLFDPITIPTGARATAFARHQGHTNCVIVSAQDSEGRQINLANEGGS